MSDLHIYPNIYLRTISQPENRKLGQKAAETCPNAAKVNGIFRAGAREEEAREADGVEEETPDISIGWF